MDNRDVRRTAGSNLRKDSGEVSESRMVGFQLVLPPNRVKIGVTFSRYLPLNYFYFSKSYLSTIDLLDIFRYLFIYTN
jgi:hypothetical protein